MQVDNEPDDERASTRAASAAKAAGAALVVGHDLSSDGPDTIQLLEETMEISKRQVSTGTVTVSTRTEVHDDVAEVTLSRHAVDVTRVPIGRVVESNPVVRTEGDTTIVPVIEERFVVVKQIFLKEELHIRHVVEREVVGTPVQLRRQHAVVERRDADGNLVEDPGRGTIPPRDQEP